MSFTYGSDDKTALQAKFHSYLYWFSIQDGTTKINNNKPKYLIEIHQLESSIKEQCSIFEHTQIKRTGVEIKWR